MSADSASHVRRCHHCGRAVHETLHTRGGYAVDFYALFTGEAEAVTISDPHDGSTQSVLRLVRPFEVFTCSDCYRQPAVRAERERLFRPEHSTESQP